MDMQTRDRTHIVAIFYNGLEYDNPSAAALFTVNSVMVHSVVDHTIPGDLYVPQAYLDKMMPSWNRICDMEAEYANYDAFTNDLKAEYNQAWRTMYPYLPQHVQQAIDDGDYLNEDWHQITAEGLQKGIDKAIALEQAHNAKRS